MIRNFGPGELRKLDGTEMLVTVKGHWNSRAKLGEKAGTQDLIAKQLEMRAILAEVQRLQPKRILEVGCGVGELARHILAHCPWVEQYDACDNAEGMIVAAAQLEIDPRLTLRCCELDDLFAGPYDCVITERMLINLREPAGDSPVDVERTWQKRKTAIDSFAARLSVGGWLLMCENSQSGYETLMAARVCVGLDAYPIPWHNGVYLSDHHLATVESLKLERCDQFSSTHYFLSRVIEASLAKLECREPRYDSPVNQLALCLPSHGPYSQGRLWTWRKV